MAKKAKIKEASQLTSQTNIRLSKTVRGNLEKLGYEITHGITKACNIQYYCGRATLKELTKKFTKGELSQLAKAQRNRSLPSDEQLHSVRNYIAFLEDLIDRDEIQFQNKKTVFGKIKSLTAFQICILREEIDLAWKRQVAGKTNSPIDSLIDKLT